MTLASLLESFRKVFAASQRRQSLDEENHLSDKADEVDENVDPMNPFPDPVVIAFRDVLDLHSIPPRQMRAVVEDYLEEAHTRRVPYLRIIHGKGIGVQREAVRAILASKAYVKDFRDAPMDAGGWGATIVELKIGSD